MPIYDLKECSDNYEKTLGNLWQYHKEYPNGNITNLKSITFKARIATRASGNSNKKGGC